MNKNLSFNFPAFSRNKSREFLSLFSPRKELIFCSFFFLFHGFVKTVGRKNEDPSACKDGHVVISLEKVVHIQSMDLGSKSDPYGENVFFFCGKKWFGEIFQLHLSWTFSVSFFFYFCAAKVRFKGKSGKLNTKVTQAQQSLWSFDLGPDCALDEILRSSNNFLQNTKLLITLSPNILQDWALGLQHTVQGRLDWCNWNQNAWSLQIHQHSTPPFQTWWKYCCSCMHSLSLKTHKSAHFLCSFCCFSLRGCTHQHNFTFGWSRFQIPFRLLAVRFSTQSNNDVFFLFSLCLFNNRALNFCSPYFFFLFFFCGNKICATEPRDPTNDPRDGFDKHVMIISRGTRGDVQPFVALARGMANQLNWKVTICTELRLIVLFFFFFVLKIVEKLGTNKHKQTGHAQVSWFCAQELWCWKRSNSFPPCWWRYGLKNRFNSCNMGNADQ